MDENDDSKPSTSQQAAEQLTQGDQESRSSNSDKEIQDNQDRRRCSSDTSMSHLHSDHSRLEMGRERPKTTGKKGLKANEIKRRPTGRIIKRSRPDVKRPALHRSKRLQNKKKRLSVSTVFTRLSSDATIKCCPYCGHRCCHRRYYEMKRGRTRRNRKRVTLHFKCMATQTAKECASEGVQVGSRCLMLSPLCINTSCVQKPVTEENNSTAITPEMIHAIVRSLTMWREEVNTEAILESLKHTYPVRNNEQLLEELRNKLRIAAIVGIVTQTRTNFWRLSSMMEKQKLTMNHVTLFWKIYGDNQKPAKKKPVEIPQEPVPD